MSAVEIILSIVFLLLGTVDIIYKQWEGEPFLNRPSAYYKPAMRKFANYSVLGWIILGVTLFILNWKLATLALILTFLMQPLLKPITLRLMSMILFFSDKKR